MQGAWEELPDESEMADDYGLGTRPGLEDAVEAVLSTLGMAPCEGTDVVPPNARWELGLCPAHAGSASASGRPSDQASAHASSGCDADPGVDCRLPRFRRLELRVEVEGVLFAQMQGGAHA